MLIKTDDQKLMYLFFLCFTFIHLWLKSVSCSAHAVAYPKNLMEHWGGFFYVCMCVCVCVCIYIYKSQNLGEPGHLRTPLDLPLVVHVCTFMAESTLSSGSVYAVIPFYVHLGSSVF